MEALTWLEIVYCSFVVVFSYAVRGSAGFGAVTIPLVALVLPMKIVVPVVTVLGICSSWTIVFRETRFIDMSELKRLLPYSVAGALGGLYLFNAFDAGALAHGLGALVVTYGSYALWQSVRPTGDWRLPRAMMLPVSGTVAGFVGTLFGAMAGMFYAIYLDARRLGKDEFRATMAATLFALGIIRGSGYIALGAFDREALIACAFALPLMAVGVVLGNHIHTNLSQTAFRRIVSVVLIASGLPLLLK